MEPKKDHFLTGIRIPQDFCKRYDAALKHYGASHPGFHRAAMRSLVNHYEKHDRIILPLDLRIERLWACPHCHHEFMNVDKRGREFGQDIHIHTGFLDEGKGEPPRG
jgi:hypothetical protein